MSLPPGDLNSLLDILSSDMTDHQTFETIANSLHSKIPKCDPIRVGSVLVFLLQQANDLLPSQTQRLAALFLLYELFRTENVANNPFVPVLLHAVTANNDSDTLTGKDAQVKPNVQQQQPNKHNRIESPIGSLPKFTRREKRYIGLLLSGAVTFRDLIKYTPKQVITLEPTIRDHAKDPDLTAIVNKVNEKISSLPATATSGIPVIVSDPDSRSFKYRRDPEPAKRATVEPLVCSEDAPIDHILKPQIICLPPPLHYCEDELVILNPNPTLPSDASFDTMENVDPCDPSAAGAASDLSSGDEQKALNLLKKAFTTTLTPSEQSSLQDALKGDSKLVASSGLNPNKLPLLVEKNPLIANDILLIIVQKSPLQIVDYLSVLVHMEISVHSLEVVNRLFTTVDLPSEFIHLYINNCISSCENVKEKNWQGRLVRIICVFLQSLIRNHIIDAVNYSIPLEPFCVQFSRIKEAAELFRLLKQKKDPSDSHTDADAAGSIGGSFDDDTGNIESKEDDDT